LDAVVAAVSVMEDDAAFNAGRGSKLTIMGHVEMDAAIMEGLNMKAGKSEKYLRFFSNRDNEHFHIFLLRICFS
jgi:hypothetical protein